MIRMRDIYISENTKRAATLFSFVVILFMVFQLIVFREYAFESAWLYAKEATGLSNDFDIKKMGAICNSLGRPQCSARVFTELVKENPGDLEVLSNLAMAFVGLKKYVEAEPYFMAYFAGGGIGQDVMLSYAKSWRKRGHRENAILWYYNVLYYNLNNELATKELFGLLHEMGRSYEAQSLLASLLTQASSDEQKLIWKMQAQSREVSTAPGQSRRIALPALDGRNFYIPVRTDGQVSGFIHSAESETETQISREDLSKYGLDSKKISASRILIKSLNIGPFELKNFEASICEKCDSRLGGQLLSRVSAYIDGRGKVPYLIMQEGEE